MDGGAQRLRDSARRPKKQRQGSSMEKNIVVLGAGVIGLTTAVYLLELGFNTTIVAEFSPLNPSNIGYTSSKAAANWRSFAKQDDQKQQFLDGYTFEKLWALTKPDRETADPMDELSTNHEADPDDVSRWTGCHRSRCFDLWKAPCQSEDEWRDRLLWFHSTCPGFKELNSEELQLRKAGFGFCYLLLVALGQAC
jgi:glycine/D-amino acid oxidase-like deaminating enzyme